MHVAGEFILGNRFDSPVNALKLLIQSPSSCLIASACGIYWYTRKCETVNGNAENEDSERESLFSRLGSQLVGGRDKRVSNRVPRDVRTWVSHRRYTPGFK